MKNQADYEEFVRVFVAMYRAGADMEAVGHAMDIACSCDGFDLSEADAYLWEALDRL